MDPRVERAAAALRRGEVESALAGLEQVLKDSPADTRALSLSAQALLVAGRPREAADRLERLRRLDPRAEHLDYFQGLAAYRLQDWPAARQLLRSALSRQPDSGVLHLLYAVTLQETGEAGAAERELTRAEELDPELAGQVAYRRGIGAVRGGRLGEARGHFGAVGPALPGTALSRSAESFQQWLGAGRGGQVFSAAVTAGTGYDSNINLAADDDTISSDQQDAALGLLDLSLGARVFERGGLSVALGEEGGFRFHFGESEFDLAESRTGVSTTYQALPWLRAGLAYTFEYLAADYDTFRLTHAVEPSLRISALEQHPTRIFFRFEPRTYDEHPVSSNLDRDGIVYRTGFDQFISLADWWGFGRSYLRFGYQARAELADGRDFDSLGHMPLVELGLALPARSLGVVRVSNEWRSYAHPSTFLPSAGDRDDVITEVSAGVQKQLGQRLELGLTYDFTHRQSDAGNLFDYQRHIVEALATFRW